MHFRNKKYWQGFPNDVFAIGKQDALLLSNFLKFTQENMLHLKTFEVIDIRRYRLITKKSKVAQILNLPSSELSFLFPVNKN